MKSKLPRRLSTFDSCYACHGNMQRYKLFVSYKEGVPMCVAIVWPGPKSKNAMRKTSERRCKYRSTSLESTGGKNIASCRTSRIELFWNISENKKKDSTRPPLAHATRLRICPDLFPAPPYFFFQIFTNQFVAYNLSFLIIF